MRSKAIVLIGCTLALLLTFGSSTFAEQGDCNDDGYVSTGDMVYLGNYLSGSGPAPPEPGKCDCDGFPGLNVGDVMQLAAWLIYGHTYVTLYDSPGTDLLQPSYAEFYIVGEPDGVNSFEVDIVVDIPFNVYGVQAVFSFSPEAGQSVLNCTGVDFTGSVATGLGYAVNNTNKTFRITGSSTGSILIPAGSRGHLCTATFELAGTSGDPVEVNPAAADRFSSLLLKKFYYQGADLQRVYFPNFHHWPMADLNCDGMPNIVDVTYYVAWLFSSGPPPFDTDDDGIPDCYSTR